ncbi:hypothetical protein [Streptomyces sp. B3I8]|uniref:hypothetical protein n=1 Tax=Streptomyces sp. B3I8 TaxID=3042303 RepID=UPI0027D80EE0|nr:hypothetical protein [Streptomyces sp. B3I8]
MIVGIGIGAGAVRLVGPGQVTVVVVPAALPGVRVVLPGIPAVPVIFPGVPGIFARRGGFRSLGTHRTLRAPRKFEALGKFRALQVLGALRSFRMPVILGLFRVVRVFQLLGTFRPFGMVWPLGYAGGRVVGRAVPESFRRGRTAAARALVALPFIHDRLRNGDGPGAAGHLFDVGHGSRLRLPPHSVLRARVDAAAAFCGCEPPSHDMRLIAARINYQ